MTRTLTNKIYETMKRDIIKGIYPAHDKLPSERELTGKYGANRFAVREAIAMLTQSGFVETRPQSGSYVKDIRDDISLEMLIEILRIRREIDRKTLESFLQFRYNIETAAAAEAAVYINGEELDSLEMILKRKKRNLSDIAVVNECDFAFHYSIIKISKNIISQLIFKSFRPLYSFFTEFFYAQEGAPQESLRLNERLLQTLSQNDQEASRKAMSHILKYGEEKVYSAINKSKQDVFLFMPPTERSVDQT